MKKIDLNNLIVGITAAGVIIQIIIWVMSAAGSPCLQDFEVLKEVNSFIRQVLIVLNAFL